MCTQHIVPSFRPWETLKRLENYLPILCKDFHQTRPDHGVKYFDKETFTKRRVSSSGQQCKKMVSKYVFLIVWNVLYETWSSSETFVKEITEWAPKYAKRFV